EAPAVEAGRVAEDERSLRRSERQRATGDVLRELFVRRVVLAQGTPRPQPVELAARRAARHVLERPGLVVDVDEVEEGLQQVPVVEVPVPRLRRAAFAVA